VWLQKRPSEDPIVLKQPKSEETLELRKQLVKNTNLTIQIKRIISSTKGTKVTIWKLKALKLGWGKDSNGAIVLILRCDFSVIEFEKGKNGISVVNQKRLDPV